MHTNEASMMQGDSRGVGGTIFADRTIVVLCTIDDREHDVHQGVSIFIMQGQFEFVSFKSGALFYLG